MNTINRVYKYRMYPTPSQKRLLLGWMEQGKFIYNFNLQCRSLIYSLQKRDCPKEEQDINLVKRKSFFPEGMTYESERKKGLKTKGAHIGEYGPTTYVSNKFHEYKEANPNCDLNKKDCIPSVCVITIHESAQRAYEDFFKNIKKSDKTKPCKLEEKRQKDEFSLNDRKASGEVVVGNNPNYAWIHGFAKIKHGIKVRLHRKSRQAPGVMNGQTITYKDGQWYLSVIYEIELKNPLPKTGKTVGIDLGVVKHIALSDGTERQLPIEQIRTIEERIKKLQYKIRKKKGGNKNKKEKQSNNFRKAYKRIRKLHAKIAAIRDYHQKMIATEIVRDNDVVSMEKLKVKNMTKSAAGTTESPGSNVKQKSGLNRSILRVAPYAFRSTVKYKCQEMGRDFVEIKPAYTSLTCSQCGHVGKKDEVRPTQADFTCTSCGFTMNADFNAARNINKKGIDELNKKENELS